MARINAVLNQGSSYTTVAIEAFAHGSEFKAGGFGSRHFAKSPALSAVGDPTLFSVRRGNKNGSFAFAVADLQRPFSFETRYVGITDNVRANRVYDNQVGVAQNEFWSEPETVNHSADSETTSNVEKDVVAFSRIENNLNNIETIKQQAGYGPNKIGARSKNSVVLHASIIAGASKDEKRNQK